MKKRKCHKIISIALILMLVLSVAPMQVFADAVVEAKNTAIVSDVQYQQGTIKREPTITVYEESANSILGIEEAYKESSKSEGVETLEAQGLPYFVCEEILLNEIDTGSLSKNILKEILNAMSNLPYEREELKAKTQEVVGILSKKSGVASRNATGNQEISALASFFNLSEESLSSVPINEESLKAAILEDCDFDMVPDSKTMPMAAAAAATTDPFEDVKINVEKVLSAPFMHTDSAYEQVNLASGDLEYKVQDALLPGRGGLDLVIETEIQFI